MVQARFILRAALIAALTTACAARTEVDVARAMCVKNIQCGNFYEPVDDCAARVAATMPPASCSSGELSECTKEIDDEPCRSPEAALPAACGVCE